MSPILNLPQLKGVSADQGGPTWEYSGYIRGRDDHRAHGYGECVYSDGQSYNGVQGVGRGLVCRVGFDCCSGEYRDDLFHGHGRHSYVNGEVYEGEYRRGLKHGRGRYT
jgi:hypothetical protein